MGPQRSDREPNADPTAPGTQPPASWGRPLAIAAALVFVVSSAFPLAAGFVMDRDAWPKWWGTLDIAIAFVLAVLAFAVVGFGQRRVDKQAEDASYRAYRFLTHGILCLLVVFMLFGDRIVWGNCLTGFGWRAWLLLYCLPAWFAAARGGASSPAEAGAAPDRGM